MTDHVIDKNQPFEERVAQYQVNSFEVLKKYCLDNKIEDDERNFRWLGIKTPTGDLTNLGFLLSDENFYNLLILEVDPTNPAFVLKSHECKGSILSQADEAVEFLTMLYGKNLFATEETYPLVAVREAVMNLYIHRDYDSLVRPMIRVWPDRVEFINGTVGEMLDAESIKLGLAMSKNPKLANIFCQFHRSLAIGSGLMKIKDAYEPYAVEPSVKVLRNAFVLTLPNTRQQTLPVGRKSNAHNHAQSLNVQKAIKLFSDSGSDGLTRQDVDDALGVSQTRSSAIIRDLLALNVVEKIGTGRNIRYRFKGPIGN